MANKRDLTKELLADCFKTLLETVPFSKITIRMITDKAGLIRPTFYKHFQDKYEVIEWIFQTEVIDKVSPLLDNGMEAEALLMLLRCLEKDKAFYRRVYPAEGPNSFENLLYTKIYEEALIIMNTFSLSITRAYPLLTPELLADIYTQSFVNLVKRWIKGEIECTADELCDAYKVLLSSSLINLIAGREA